MVPSEKTIEFEPVIGLEVHAELKTESGMFCSCRNEFGGEPNTRTCPVCLGLPGSLPVINKQAVELAMRFGLAVGSEIGRAIFHRKNYFYPDMPKDFQISQYDEPICRGGTIEALDSQGETFTVQLERAHLEEDTGKSRHVGGGGGRIHGATYTLVDYNRSGVPLLEIVSKPDIRNPDQARSYVAELRAILEMLEISDVKMEEGSLRVDANVSLRPKGDSKLGTKVEVKNMNSLRSLQRALEYEIGRQKAVLASGDSIAQETRHWNEDEGRTHTLRSKEEAFDYRYFPEPDLVPIKPDQAWIAQVAETVPAQLPAARVRYFVEEYGVPAELAGSVIYTKDMADWVESEIAAGADARSSFNWASQEVLAFMNDSAIDFVDVNLPVGSFVELTELISVGTLSKKLARNVVADVLRAEKHGTGPQEIVTQQGLAQVSDTDEITSLIREVLDNNLDAVEKFRAGNDKILGFLVGQVMKASRGKANPNTANSLVKQLLDNSAAG